MFKDGRTGVQKNVIARFVSASCAENEEYLDCGSSCPLTCSNFQESLFCTKQCTKGCFCKPGYVLGPNKKCILPQNCPIGPCQGNEVTTDCVNPCNNCAQRGKCTFEFCGRGCDCKHGFHRNSTGHCVEAKDCDVPESLCPKHEHFVPCVNQCNDCWSRGDCDQSFCQPGCDCSPGFFRDDNGDCVPESQCIAEEISCGVNEEYTDCVNPCNDCVKQGQCQYNCEYGCDCKKGYFKDSRGVCIPAEQCASALDSRNCRSCRDKCPINQQYYICMPTCKTTCENFNSTAPCEADCRSGCFCKQGLVKRSDGVCILPSDCPQKCGLNEEYSICGPACPESCENFGKSVMCTHQCVKGCFCKRGFIRGPQGTCIQPQLCPAVCRENEEFRKCGTPCPATCHNHTNPRPCPEFCVRGCACKPGYVKGPDGRCILPQECPVECKEKEEYMECGPPCPSTCDNIGKSPCAVPCTKGCFCRSGLVRGPDGKCIPPALCPVACGPNQEFLECGPACPLSCTNYTLPTTHANVNECHRGCFCKSGFVIGPDGSCIPITSCPSVCEENEVFQECGTACPVTCDNRLVSQQCKKRCLRGCFCAPGFIRGPFGKCILPQECPQGENRWVLPKSAVY
ncbi:Zonadhesin [Araneus ventricosus]|uniref:Zonadhesin n=1 Tax=Araneus ventricosus TaxID=182803 RepID=A0A4Y2K8N7_ARAVE|nr:Zonadhesin [Araneus ventricosus]